MATSSIFHIPRIDTPEKVEAFMRAIEESESHSASVKSKCISKPVGVLRGREVRELFKISEKQE